MFKKELTFRTFHSKLWKKFSRLLKNSHIYISGVVVSGLLGSPPQPTMVFSGTTVFQVLPLRWCFINHMASTGRWTRCREKPSKGLQVIWLGKHQAGPREFFPRMEGLSSLEGRTYFAIGDTMRTRFQGTTVSTKRALGYLSKREELRRTLVLKSEGPEYLLH